MITFVCILSGVALVLLGCADFSGVSSALVIYPSIRKELSEVKCLAYQKSRAPIYIITGMTFVLNGYLARGHWEIMYAVCALALLGFCVVHMRLNKRHLGRYTALHFAKK